MQTMRIFFLAVLSTVITVARAQDDPIIRQYIITYKDIAIAEMQRTGVPASIKLAQGIHETMAGTSDLVRQSNNHFGIKCKSDWTGETVFHDDDARGECFRKYNSPADSYADHSDFLKKSQRYAALFTLDPLDYEGWAYGLKKAGYATNPKYPAIIIKLIEDYHLQDYSLIALGKLAPGNELLAKYYPSAGNTTITAAVHEQDSDAAQPAVITPAVVIESASYPPGEFKINDVRVIYAAKGASFLSIAQEYNVPLARLFEYNELNEAEALDKDQLLFLQRKRKSGSTAIHVVKAGETVESIAQAEGIRLEYLLEYNGIGRSARLIAGDQLYLRAKAPAGFKRHIAVNE